MRVARSPSVLAVVSLVLASGFAFAQTPSPLSTGPGCWEWQYDPTKPIPSDAKVVPGTCPTPDGRCYVLPSSACFEFTGVDQPLFDERPLTDPAATPPFTGPPVRLPVDPLPPSVQRPINPKGHVPTPLPQAGQCTPGTGWDFETFLDNVTVFLTPGVPITTTRGYASLDRWRGDGIPGQSPFLDFRNPDQNLKAAPAYGNAVPISRIRPPGWRADIEAQIGGDYWRFSQDINQSGDFWIGSLDRRYSWRQHPGEHRDTWGEKARGTLTSPECALQSRYLSFRLGGSSHGSQRVEVHVQGGSPRDYFGVRLRGGPGDPTFAGAMGHPTQFSTPHLPQLFPPPTGRDGWTIVRSAMPVGDTDWMQVFVFDLAPFVGRTMRIRIVDDRRDQWVETSSGVRSDKPEHLQADDFRFLAAAPEGTEWMRHSDGRCGDVRGTGDGCSPVGRVPSEPPLWGVTDVHAHPMANIAFGSHFFWGDPADSLEQVYDCSKNLDAIDGTGGRPAIGPSHKRTTCYLHGAAVAVATASLFEGCEVLNVVPWVGPTLAVACKVVVTAAAAVALNVPVMSGARLHGAAKVSSGAVKFGVLFSGLLDILPDLELDFTVGLIPQTDHFGTATGGEAGGWWKKDEDWHSPSGMGKTHNAYQVDMIRRAFQGGMRLGVWDVINSRALSLVADGAMTSDWQALESGTAAAKRIVAVELSDIATVAYTPDEAERIIRSGKMAVILGAEVDELGRMRPEGLPGVRSPQGGPDSMQKQVDDLWALGIRKVSPVHAVNNPIGGAALFNTDYDSNNYFLSGTTPEGPLGVFDHPPIPFFLDGSFGALLQDLFLGDFGMGFDPVQPSQPPWNPKDWFDFALGPHPHDTFIGEDERITYRIGLDGAKLLQDSQGNWLPVDQVVGKQVKKVTLLKSLTLAFSGPTCNLYNTTLPETVTTFGDEVDLRYTQAAGHRNALGLFVDPEGGNDGRAFLRAAMKRGMLIDTDHLSQNTRVELYGLTQDYALEAGWPAGQCRGADGRCGPCGTPAGEMCGAYPTVGVHSKVRGLEIDPNPLQPLRNAYGSNDEASRSEREVKWVAENGGTFAVFPTGSAMIPPNTVRCTKDSDCATYGGPGSSVCLPTRKCVAARDTVVARDFALPAEVGNDCDESSKTFAVKYLWLLDTTDGRGLTPATDINGLITTLKPRYGTSMSWSPACGGSSLEADGVMRSARDRTDQGTPTPSQGWHAFMVAAQAAEASGVWYDDYAARSPTPAAAGSLWGDPRYKDVVARRASESREDLAPRARVDDHVFYNNFGPDNRWQLGPEYQMGNRPGAQMYPMKRWQVLPGRAGWDFNLDGLRHIGLYPDLWQDMRNVGVQWEQMGPLFHSADAYIATWRKAMTIGAAHP